MFGERRMAQTQDSQLFLLLAALIASPLSSQLKSKPEFCISNLTTCEFIWAWRPRIRGPALARGALGSDSVLRAPSIFPLGPGLSPSGLSRWHAHFLAPLALPIPGKT